MIDFLIILNDCPCPFAKIFLLQAFDAASAVTLLSDLVDLLRWNRCFVWIRFHRLLKHLRFLLSSLFSLYFSFFMDFLTALISLLVVFFNPILRLHGASHLVFELALVNSQQRQLANFAVIFKRVLQCYLRNCIPLDSQFFDSGVQCIVIHRWAGWWLSPSDNSESWPVVSSHYVSGTCSYFRQLLLSL